MNNNQDKQFVLIEGVGTHDETCGDGIHAGWVEVTAIRELPNPLVPHRIFEITDTDGHVVHVDREEIVGNSSNLSDLIFKGEEITVTWTNPKFASVDA